MSAQTATGFDDALLAFLIGFATAGIVALAWLVIVQGWSP